MNFTVVCGEQRRRPLTETYHVVSGYDVLCWFMVNRQDRWPKPATVLYSCRVFCWFMVNRQDHWPKPTTVLYNCRVFCWFMVNRQDDHDRNLPHCVRLWCFLLVYDEQTRRPWPKPTTLCTVTMVCVEQRGRRDAAAIEAGAGLFPAGRIHAAERGHAEGQGHSRQAVHWPWPVHLPWSLPHQDLMTPLSLRRFDWLIVGI